MATESKTRTYRLVRESVLTTLGTNTGQAAIAEATEYEIEIVDPLATPGNKSWTITASGNETPEFYDTQTYTATDNEIANFVNGVAGTSFAATDIVNVRSDADTSFFEVETT